MYFILIFIEIFTSKVKIVFSTQSDIFNINMDNKASTKKVKIIKDNKKSGLAIKELNHMLNKWQKKLLLNDWDISIKIVDFLRTDYRQSGDFEINAKAKKATILLTQNPFKNEETVLVHELIHVLLWDMDSFSENAIIKTCKKFEGNHLKYMEKLENLVDSLVKIALGK